MILVDSRAGSSDLHPQLVARGLPSSLCRLEYGDVSFIGNGPTGPASIGIEYKRIGDALACMAGGRYAGHQLPGMAGTYQWHWLLLEGIVRCGSGNESDGVLQVRAWPEGWRDYRQGSRYIMYRDWCHWLMSLQQMAGVRIAHTSSLRESTAWIAALYSWWQKQWGDHRSVQAVYMPNVPSDGGALGNVLGHKPSLRRLWAMQLPGIGVEKSKTIELAFPTALELAVASSDRWMEVDGIGKTLAQRIVDAIGSGQ